MSWISLAGGVIGLLGGGNQGGSTSQNTIDPRIADLLYGNGGLLNNASALQKQQSSQGGLNPMQMAGLETQRQVLTDPNYSQGYGLMRSLGGGLMGQGVAGNPFTGGQTAFPQPQLPPMQFGQPRESIGMPTRDHSLGFGAAMQPLSQMPSPVAADLVKKPINNQRTYYGNNPNDWPIG